MYRLLLLFLFVSLAQAKKVDGDYAEYSRRLDLLITEKWMTLPLNHFNLFDNRTWNMRYHVFDRYFEKGGPIFIEVGGEWTIRKASLISGQLPKLAAKHKGLLVQTEHRYYGQSLPFQDFTVENLEFLQMEQALEDLAYFIETFKSLRPELKDNKVVIHGCSYPGMLVTWMRVRFPHLVDIAYASSAPLGVGMEYADYFQIVSDTYANVSTACFKTIKEGFKQMLELAKTHKGKETIRNALRDWDCGDVEDLSIPLIHMKMIGILNVMHDPAQYEELGCLVMGMNTADLSPYERLARFVVFKSKDFMPCRPGMITQEAIRKSVAWSYQICTEQGTFLTLDRDNSRNPFAVHRSVDEAVEDCRLKFGDRVTEDVLKAGIERVTRRYGGKRPKVTKVVTVQGTHDPWKHLASLEDYTSEAPVIMVEGSHCIDNTEREDDPEHLLETRKKVRNLISKWIREIS